MNLTIYVPINVPGPGTEYGLLLVNCAGHLLDALIGSIDRSACRTRSRVTFFHGSLNYPTSFGLQHNIMVNLVLSV